MRPFISLRPSTCLAAALGLLLVPSALAATISVPADHPTIQAAVNAAASGDVIEITPGTYVGDVNIVGKQLTLVGTGTLPGDVVVQGTGSGSVLDITGGADVSILNLNITGGVDQPAGVGGGVDIRNSDASLQGVAIIGNESNAGAGLFIDNGELVMNQCLLQGNAANGGGGGMYIQNSDADLTGVLVWNNTYSNGAIFSLNSSVVLDRSHFTGNSGTGAVLQASGTISGSAITVTNTVINANTGSGPIGVTEISAVKVFNCTVAENDSSSYGLASVSGEFIVGNTIAIDPDRPAVTGGGTVDARYSNISGGLPGAGMIDVDPMFKAGAFFQLDAGSPCVDAANGNAIPNTPDFLGQPRFVDDQNVADDGVGTLTYLDMGAIERQPMIRYVNDDATGSGSGLSWADAMTDLQDALDDAAAGGVEEIWIAAGTYKPDRGTGDRSMSFEMQNGLTILGGFAGTEELRADADASVNQSILGGELGAPGPADNTLHVVRAIDVNETGRLGGVIIQRGNADVGDAVDGGGIRIINGAPQFNEIWIRQCEGSGLASAIFSSNASPAFNRLRVNRNGWNSAPASTMRLIGGSPVFVNARIHGNQQEFGGALYFDEADAAIVANATIWGNTSTDSWCAGLFNSQGEVDVRNTIVWGNIALAPIAGQPVSQDNVFGILGDARYTTVEGWPNTLTNGRNGRDPRFVDAAGPDGTVGTFDDDLRLSAGSCLIDSGDSTLLPAIFATDVFGVDRFLDDPGTADTGVANADGMVVDRGAHEFAGVSCGGDVDGSGDVGFSDLLEVLASWGACVNCPADVNCDDVVDFDDLLTVLAAWGPCP
jgi:hypothetical protein